MCAEGKDERMERCTFSFSLTTPKRTAVADNGRERRGAQSAGTHFFLLPRGDRERQWQAKKEHRQ